MKDYILTVNARIDPNSEERWNQWYNRTHLPAILSCPGVLSGARYVNDGEEADRRYLTVYELERLDALRSPEFRDRRGWGEFLDKVKYETIVWRRLYGE